MMVKLLFLTLAIILVTSTQGAAVPSIRIFHNKDSSADFLESLKLATKIDVENPPCKGHDRFEGGFYLYYAKSKTEVIGNSFSYDGPNKKTRTLITTIKDGKATHTNAVLLYNEKTMYVVDMDSHHCTKLPITFPWQPMGQMPENATYGGQFYIGAANIAGQGLLVDMYYGTQQGNYWGLMTRDGCWSVGGGYDQPDNDYKQASFYDLTDGIKDPSIFDVPKECLEVSTKEE